MLDLHFFAAGYSGEVLAGVVGQRLSTLEGVYCESQMDSVPNGRMVPRGR